MRISFTGESDFLSKLAQWAREATSRKEEEGKSGDEICTRPTTATTTTGGWGEEEGSGEKLL